MRHLALLLALFALPAQAGPVPVDPAEARVQAAGAAYTAVEQRFEVGSATSEDVYRWSVRWYTAEHDAGVATAATAHSRRMHDLAAIVDKKMGMGLAGDDERLACRYYTAEADYWAR